MSVSRTFTPVIEKLRAAGLRPTRQRIALASLMFSGADRHMCAEDLHAEAAQAGIRVSLATVYNTLHQFTDGGLLREIAVNTGRSYFDTNTSSHHHFFYEGDDRLEDIAEDDVVLSHLPSPPKGMKVAGIDVVVRLTKDIS